MPYDIPKKRRVTEANKAGDGTVLPQHGAFKAAAYSIDEDIVLLPWNTDEGRERLLNTPHNKAFFRLAHCYQPQKNPFFCGVASMVTVLNALRVHRGMIPSQPGLDFIRLSEDGDTYEKIRYRLYSQMTLLDDETEKVKKKSRIAPVGIHAGVEADAFEPGLSLEHVKAMLEIYETKVSATHAHDDVETGMAEFRDVVLGELEADKRFVIANFDGQVIGGATGGHFSVIGAYHEETDSLLILDSAAHKTPWYWVCVKHLYFAMNTLDGDEKRGYLVVEDTH